MKKKRWPVLLIYAAALIICAVLIYAVPEVLGLFDSTYIAKYGEIEVSRDAEAYVFRDDRVYTAEQAGEIRRLVDDGALVKGRARIVEITGEGSSEVESKYQEMLSGMKDVTAAAEGGEAGKSGYVSYKIDGLESMFSVGNIDNVNRAAATEAGAPRPVDVQSGRCAAGDPVFRIAANGNWNLLFWLSTDEAAAFSEGNDITAVIEGEPMDAVVETVLSGNEVTRIVVRVNEYNEALLNSRRLDVTFVTQEAGGVILQSRSIIEKDGVKGVLVRDKVGDNQFKPVRIKADNGEEAAVYSDFFMDDDMQFVETIKTYDEVVISPSEEDIAAAADVNDKYK